MSEFDWLIEMAELVARGAVASDDIDAIRELSDFLKSFAERQKAKLEARMKEFKVGN